MYVSNHEIETINTNNNVATTIFTEFIICMCDVCYGRSTADQYSLPGFGRSRYSLPVFGRSRSGQYSLPELYQNQPGMLFTKYFKFRINIL